MYIKYITCIGIMRAKCKAMFFAALLLACTASYGQNMNDIFAMQNKTIPYGTPRFMGMSGAFGAVGGDVSAISINPAGGAMAVKTEISATMGVEWNNNKVDFYNTSTNTNSKAKAAFYQAGVNYVILFDPAYYTTTSVNLAVNYSRRNNFNNDFSFSGRNNTITDWLDDSAIGSSVIESFFRNAIDGVNGTVVDLASDLKVLDRTDDGIYPGAEYLNIDQAARILSRGSSDVTTFSIGVGITERIYVGASFDLISINLDDNNTYLDEYGFTSNYQSFANGGVSNLYYDRYTSQSGWGSAFTLGIIGRVTNDFRLGFSWKTAARINIDEYYSYAMGARFFDGSEASGTENPTFAYPNSYTFKTASEWTFSGSYVFGQFGLLSVDYMLKDYSKMRFKNPGFERENEIIKDQMKISQTLRVGAEARLYPLTLRAGFSYISSPYKDVTVTRVSQSVPGTQGYVTLPQGVGDTIGFSAGLGYSVGNFLTIDAAYVNSSATTYHYLYEPALVDAAKNKISSSYISLGVTFRI